MPAVLSIVPDTFKYVLRRYDRSPRLALRVACYGENVVSRSIDFQGVTAPTIFLHTSPARDRAVKLGWLDETASFQSSAPKDLTKPDKKTRRRRAKKGK